MKRTYRKIIPILLIGIIAWMAWQIRTQVRQKATIEAARETLPAFEFSTLAGEPYTRSHLPHGKALVIMLIHPECPHCQYEAKTLYQKRELHLPFHWILVSEAAHSQLEEFSQTYGLKALENVQLLKADLGQFYQYFGTEVMPSTFLYDSQYKLITHYKGEVKIEAIVKHLPAI